MTSPELLRVREAAAYLNLTESAIRAFILKRQVPVVRIARSVRLRRSDLDAWIEQGTTPAAAPRRRAS